MGKAKFSIKARRASHTKTVIESRDFKLIIDEPEHMGGTDEGPNPVEYLAAALAGCLNVTGHMVANEMGIKIENLEFEVEGELDPRGFMGKANNVRPGYSQMNIKVNVETDADNETLNKWLDIVEKRCPVSDNIQNTTPINLSIIKK
ncbi:osmotically inducible protein C [Tepiditoga spiralis]|uniref:Osmotically inducible protein C n=1 Tax=Tepiditoga spiralis TaxID=2108365 RepID=A0A7G1G2K8_9BACT|nr:OsmC family protein [Tepiditoga spiralis]BBE30528.1 osmotically inducible protein C [Tepiditoga spiralis]